MKYKYLLFLLSFLAGCFLASNLFGQNIAATLPEGVQTGRQYVIEIVAELDGESADLLIDIDGELDHNLFEENSKLCFTPTAPGVIKVKVVSIWWGKKKAQQRILKIKVEAGKDDSQPPLDGTPGGPDKPGVPFTSLTKAVSDMAAKLGDVKGQSALKSVYSDLSEAVRSGETIEISYFNTAYQYDLSDPQSRRNSANLAISRALSFAKANDSQTDNTDWAASFLVPLKELSNDYNLDDRVVFSDFLAAVAAGL